LIWGFIIFRSLYCQYKIIQDLKRDIDFLNKYSIVFCGFNLLKRNFMNKIELKNDLSESHKKYFEEINNMWKFMLLYFTAIALLCLLTQIK